MQKTTGNKVRLGIFVSIGISLFIVGIYYIGQRQQLFNDTIRVSGVFKDISGLQVGNNVRFCGIDIGIVEDIEQITDSTVRVDMAIDEHSKKFIKKNAKAFIGSDGLMGNKIVSIVPGIPGEKSIVNNDTLATARHVSIDDILIKVKVTSDNAADITNDIAVIMKNIREGKGTLGKLIMDSTVAENVGTALVNIKQGAGGFKNNMDAAKNSFFLKHFLRKKKNEEEMNNNKKTVNDNDTVNKKTKKKWWKK